MVTGWKAMAEMMHMIKNANLGNWVLTIRSASALRFSKGCSSLNLDRMLEFIRLVSYL